jgi:hypothetical protein
MSVYEWKCIDAYMLRRIGANIRQPLKQEPETLSKHNSLYCTRNPSNCGFNKVEMTGYILEWEPGKCEKSWVATSHWAINLLHPPIVQGCVSGLARIEYLTRVHILSHVRPSASLSSTNYYGCWSQAYMHWKTKEWAMCLFYLMARISLWNLKTDIVRISKICWTSAKGSYRERNRPIKILSPTSS